MYYMQLDLLIKFKKVKYIIHAFVTVYSCRVCNSNANIAPHVSHIFPFSTTFIFIGTIQCFYYFFFPSLLFIRPYTILLLISNSENDVQKIQ